MSLWASWLVLDESDDEGLGAPFLYVASHVFPRPAHQHPSGYLELAAIPGFIGDEDFIEGGDAGVAPICGETEDRVHPWLRLSCGADDAVLNREQVEKVRDTLTEWLLRAPGR